MVSVLLNRTKIHVFDWIFKFYSNKVAVKAHGVCGERSCASVKVASQRLKQSKTAVNRLRLVNRDLRLLVNRSSAANCQLSFVICQLIRSACPHPAGPHGRSDV